MKAIANQNFVIYKRTFNKTRLLVTEGDEAEVIWKEDIKSKIRFFDGMAKGTTHIVDNMLLDFINEEEPT